MRKTLAIIMMIAMVFCYMPLTGFADTEVSTTSVNTSGFIDMPNNWSTEALSKAVGNGLLEGFKEKSGTFIKPSDPLTRAQMATIVNRAFGAKGTANLTGVKDVPQKAWYTAEMQKAVKMGTMKLDSKMRPNDPITRQEAFTVLARAFKMADGTMANLEKFSDKEKVSSWAVSSLGALARVGYIQGADGKLNPLSKITRAEFAVVMDNMIKEYINKAGTVTQVHEGNLMINVPDVILKDITVKGDLILGDGIGEGNVSLENVIVKGNLIARGGGVDSIVINGGSIEGKVVIAKVDGQIRVFVNGAQVEMVVIDDGKDDIIVEGTVGTLEITAPDVPVVLNNATVNTITVNTEGPANLQVGAGSTVTNVVVGTGSTGTTLNVEGTVTNVETSAANTNVGGTGTVTTVTTNEGANNTSVTTPSTKVNNDGATGVTAGGGTEVPSGSTATNSNTGGEATIQPTTGGTTGGGGGGGTAPDTTAPRLQGVYPAVTSGETTHWILAGDETFTFSVDAYDAGGLYELEIDHSLEGALPEFSVYADESDPYGGEDTTFAAAGVTVTYSASEMKWDIDFGDPITDMFVTNGGVTFYLVIKDRAGNQLGTMYGTTPENTFGYTFERANIVNRTQNTSHASIQAAIDAAIDGDTIQIAAGTYDESVVVPEEKVRSITILGANSDTIPTSSVVDGTIITGGMTFGRDISTNPTIEKSITVKGITFSGGSGLIFKDIRNVTVENNKFIGITAGDAAVTVLDPSPNDRAGVTTISNNYIDGVSGLGIYVRRPAPTTVIEGNHVEDTDHNSIQVVGVSAGPDVTITGNTLINWDQNEDADGGRAIRINFDPVDASTTLAVTGNTFHPNGDADPVDPDYVKITGVSTANNNVNNLISSLIDDNTWPSGTDYGTVILVNTTAGTNMAASITSESTTNYYPTIQAAIDGAIEGDTIKLLADVITTIGTCYHIRNSMTIDLNGYEISGPANGSCSDDGTNATHFFRVVSGTLTIDDTSAEKNGSIFCSYSGNSTALTVEILAGAKVVLNAGTLTNGTPYNYGGSVVYLRDTAEFTMNGGTVNGVKVLSNKRTYPIFIQGAACKFTMTGGIVTSDSDAISIPYNGAIVSISGGQLTGVPGSTALNPAYIADGSYCVFDGSKSTISETAPVAYTANINGKLYYTSSGGGNLAIAKAANGDTITLCEETTANKTLAASQTLAITIGEGGSYSGTVSTYAGYEVVSNVNGSTTTYSVALTPNSAIAEWKGTYYPTAYAALDAAYQANSEVAVVLLKDSAAITGIKGGILDLNGKKIEGSSSSGVIALSSLSSDYSLRVIDSVGGGQAINTYTNKAAVNAYYGTITIEAGTYTGNGTSNALTASAASGGKTAGTFIITGGTFSSDPTAYVASGYSANESGGVWAVTAQ